MTVNYFRVLLVESSEHFIEVIQQTLNSTVPQVSFSIARSLAQARDHLSKTTPDLAIIDSELPDGKGIELLHPHPREVDFPSIITTNHGNEKEAVEAIKAGALDFILKSPDAITSLPIVMEKVLLEWEQILAYRQVEEALSESEQRFRSFFDSAASGMAIVSPEGRALAVNPTFCRISGYSKAECLTMNVLEVTHPDDRLETGRLYDEIRRGVRKVADYVKRYLCKDGSVVWGHATVAGVFSSEGELEYFAANVQDITAQKNVEEKLILVNRELDTFTSTVAHEIRTLITPIIGYADMLESSYCSEQNKHSLEWLAEIQSQCSRMINLMEDLLDLSKVGHIEEPEESIDVDQVLTEVLLELYGPIVESGVVIERANLPKVRINKILLTQIFSNLISNAIRYTQEAGNSIEVGGSKNGGQIQFYVRDHGPGVPDKDHDLIFNIFYRGELGKKTPGSGVGLATVQKIARHYGGRVWLTETPGGGSTFWVELFDSSK